MNNKSILIIGAVVALAVTGLVLYMAQISAPAVVNAPQQSEEQTNKPETQTISAYFSNSVYDPEVSCYKVFAVERQVRADADPLRAAIEATLAGPTEEEKTKGYFTSLNPGTGITSIKREGDTVSIDFNKQLDFEVGGSCRVGAIRAQITETAKQFNGVKEVVISIAGNVDEILQP